MTDPTSGDGPQARPEWTWRERERASRIRGVFLDPDVQPAGTPEVHATVYQPDVLLIAPPARARGGEDRISRLDGLAKQWGWDVRQDDLEDAIPEEVSRVVRRRADRVRLPGVAQTVRARITISPEAEADPTRPVQRPDAWRLLREARREGITNVSLNHILTVDPIGVNPFKANPFKANPFKANPFKANPAGIDGYASPGFGGRQPVYYGGPALPRPDVAEGTRRPVVAVLDTGCGDHPWFAGEVLVDAAKEYGGAIGIVNDPSNPEVHPSLADPLDGVIDEAAGHGTFIAGLILQSCPGARILPVRVSDGQGIILENELLAALGRIVDLLESGKATIDVLNLSFSYYHESPELAAVDSELYDLLKRVRAQNCIVVCSAGNDATDRPASPAALYYYDGGELGVAKSGEARLAPHIVVGALNPSGRSVALFSNVGDWVTTYARGVSVVSSIPNFQGGAQADLRHDAYGRRRETLDVDDFEAGFAVWSGTSFAAPLVAGRIAASLTLKAAQEGRAARASSSLKTSVNKVIAAVDGDDRSPIPDA